MYTVCGWMKRGYCILRQEIHHCAINSQCDTSHSSNVKVNLINGSLQTSTTQRTLKQEHYTHWCHSNQIRNVSENEYTEELQGTYEPAQLATYYAQKEKKEPSKRGLVVFFRLINRSCDAEQFICKKINTRESRKTSLVKSQTFFWIKSYHASYFSMWT